MKKYFYLLLFGLSSMIILLPSVGNAVEEKAVQSLDSSVYSRNDMISPKATPLVKEVTLEQGQSYDLTTKILYEFKGWAPDPSRVRPNWYFAIMPSSSLRIPEYFSYQRVDSFSGVLETPEGTVSRLESAYNTGENGGNDGSFYKGCEETHWGENGREIHDVGVRITNWSSGSVTYRMAINVAYGNDSAFFRLFGDGTIGF